jgi:hypothetical protein
MHSNWKDTAFTTSISKLKLEIYCHDIITCFFNPLLFWYINKPTYGICSCQCNTAGGCGESMSFAQKQQHKTYTLGHHAGDKYLRWVLLRSLLLQIACSLAYYICVWGMGHAQKNTCMLVFQWSAKCKNFIIMVSHSQIITIHP